MHHDCASQVDLRTLPLLIDKFKCHLVNRNLWDPLVLNRANQHRTPCSGRQFGFGHDTCGVLIKDLKLQGSSAVIKVGTKVKNIRLIDGDHDIDCKIDGFGPMQLKTEFVKKA
jgi:hypothetical protein